MLAVIKRPPSLIFLKAQLKLQQRHLREWKALIADQKEVMGLVQEEAAQKIASIADQPKRTCAELKYTQAARLIKVLKRQQQERQQMLNRQLAEKESLEQEIADFPSNSRH